MTSLIMDTGTWFKLDVLLENSTIQQNFVVLLSELFEIAITYQIEKELTHFNIKSYKLIRSQITLLPITNQDLFQHARDDDFDEADASIAGINQIQARIIITEDRPLLAYFAMYELNVMFFADFVYFLLRQEVITKNSAYKLVAPLQRLRNISKKQSCRLKEKIERF